MANHLLEDSQSGFRKLKSTDDQVTYLSQDIEDAFQRKGTCHLLLLDKGIRQSVEGRITSLKLTRMVSSSTGHFMQII